MNKKLEKIDLGDCSIIVPFQYDSVQRLENVLCLINYFNNFFCGQEFIIVENGNELGSQIDTEEIIYICEEKFTYFSKAKLVNIGLSHSAKPFVLECDSDTLINPNAIKDGIDILRNDPTMHIITPFNGMAFDLKGSLRYYMMRSLDFSIFPYFKKDRYKRIDTEIIKTKNWKAKGLITLFRKETLLKLGGYNEEFISWGYQDLELLTRFEKLGYSLKRLDQYNVYHLDHPRPEHSYNYEESLKNYERLRLVKSMNPNEIIQYIKTWNQFG